MLKDQIKWPLNSAMTKVHGPCNLQNLAASLWKILDT